MDKKMEEQIILPLVSSGLQAQPGLPVGLPVQSPDQPPAQSPVQPPTQTQDEGFGLLAWALRAIQQPTETEKDHVVAFNSSVLTHACQQQGIDGTMPNLKFASHVRRVVAGEVVEVPVNPPELESIPVLASPFPALLVSASGEKRKRLRAPVAQQEGEGVPVAHQEGEEAPARKKTQREAREKTQKKQKKKVKSKDNPSLKSE